MLGSTDFNDDFCKILLFYFFPLIDENIQSEKQTSRFFLKLKRDVISYLTKVTIYVEIIAVNSAYKFQPKAENSSSVCKDADVKERAPGF